MPNSNFFLKLYAITLTFILILFLVYGFKTNAKRQEFNEITVQRINVVEPDGSLKMVISNADRQHPGMFDGELIQPRERPPGIIFFNEEQDEVGGLIFAGTKEQGSVMVLSFDQFKNDQVMQMQYQRNADGKQKYGLNLWDRSEIVTLPDLIKITDSLKAIGVSDPQEIQDVIRGFNKGKDVAAVRMFAGKNFEEQVGLFIKDESGRDRIKIYIDQNNEPQFLIFNQHGKITRQLNEE